MTYDYDVELMKSVKVLCFTKTTNVDMLGLFAVQQ